MTQDQIRKLRQSWKILCKMDPMLLEEVFYTKLFLDHPDMKSVFSKHGPLQYVKFINLLHQFIMLLDRLPELSIEIQMLAFRLHQHKMKPADYPKVGETLIWTFKKALGEDFDDHTESAWQNYYQYVVQELLNARATRNSG